MTMSPDHLIPTGTTTRTGAEGTEKRRGTATRRAILKTCGTLVAGGAALYVGRSVIEALSSVKWVAFYGQTADETVLSRYNVVVLDPAFKGSITGIAKDGACVCAYLSLGEMRITDPFYPSVDRAALLEENTAWPGTFRIDVRHRSWRGLILEQVIPHICSMDFTGLLLDTLDTPPFLEQLDPNGKRGMGQAAAELVQAIRKSFPKMRIFVNRGYSLLPNLANYIDGVLAESLMTTFDPESGGYRWNQPSEIGLQLSLLASAMRNKIHLPILSLDYWDPGNPETIKEIYARERQLGNHPYVATRMLDRIIPEPA